MICYSYCVEVLRGGRFDVEKAKANGIPLKLWNPLQKGATVEYEGRTLTPDLVLGEKRRGIRVVYSTDTRPTPDIARFASDADLLIIEGMYGDHEKDADARQKKHMTMPEAAAIACKAQPLPAPPGRLHGGDPEDLPARARAAGRRQRIDSL